MNWLLVGTYVLGMFAVLGYASYKLPEPPSAREAYELSLAALFWPFYLIFFIPMWIGATLRKRANLGEGQDG